MKPAREDYIVIYSDKTGVAAEPFLNATHDAVQRWISNHLFPGQLRSVMRTTDAPDDIDHFTDPTADTNPAYERAASRADREYRMSKEMA